MWNFLPALAVVAALGLPRPLAMAPARPVTFQEVAVSYGPCTVVAAFINGRWVVPPQGLTAPVLQSAPRRAFLRQPHPTDRAAADKTARAPL